MVSGYVRTNERRAGIYGILVLLWLGDEEPEKDFV